MADASDVLQLVDRLVGPITTQLSAMGLKLDRVIEGMAQVTIVKQTQDGHHDRLKGLETSVEQQALTMAVLKGRNQVILWSLGLIATVIGIVASAGIIHLLGWKP